MTWPIRCPLCKWRLDADGPLEANKAWGQHYLKEHPQQRFPLWFSKLAEVPA